MDMDVPPEVATWFKAVWAIWGALVGACLGSFANVVAARLPQNQSVVRPRSRCPQCLTPIRAVDNIPIISWLRLRGRARCCGVPISPRYVVVEALAAALGWAVVVVLGPNLHAAVAGVVVLLLVCIALIDLDHWVVPLELTLPLLGVAVVGRLALAWWQSTGPALEALKTTGMDVLWGAGLGFILPWGIRRTFTPLLRWTGRLGPGEEAQGEGDEHLLAGIGAFVGPQGVFTTLLLGSLQGSIVGLLLKLRTRGTPAADGAAAPLPPGAALPPPAGSAQDTPAADKGTPHPGVADADDVDWAPPKDAIPFGPFLALGAIQTLLFSDALPRVDLVALLRALLGPSDGGGFGP